MSFVGLLGLTVVSCGTYQNKSYYDSDGIYGSQKRETTQNDNSVIENQSANKYKEYFAANANNYSNDNQDVFTDVEGYSSEANDSTKTTESKNYAGWGENNSNVTINYYNNDWGWNTGWYWHNYWGYRPWRSGIYLGWNSWNYGWYDPYWGYTGYYGPSWGWYNPYYYGGYYGYYNSPYYYGNGYYGRNYAYGHGRRGSAYYSDRYNSNGYSPGRRSTYNSTYDGISNSPRNYTPRPRRGDTNNSMINNTPRPRINNPKGDSENANVNPRPRTSPRSYNDVNTPRPRTSNPKSSEYNTPRPRSESPRSSDYNTPRPRMDNPRSFDTPRSSGGNSGGSFGGGRGGRR